MGRKNVVKSFKMFDSTDISTNQTSSITNILNLDTATIVLEWTGTSPIGVITVEARNGDNENFNVVDMGSDINITGNSGNHRLVFNMLPGTSIRLVYTSTSGTGTLSAIITAQTTGA